MPKFVITDPPPGTLHTFDETDIVMRAGRGNPIVYPRGFGYIRNPEHYKMLLPTPQKPRKKFSAL